VSAPRLIAVNTAMSAMTVALGIDHFIGHLRRRGLALNTQRAYQTDLLQFEAFVVRMGQGDLVALMSSRHVSRFLDDRSAAGDTLRTQARKLATLRSFFRHARREGWIGFDPCADERVKVPHQPTVAPEREQLHAVIAAIPAEGAINLRDRALLRLLLDAGARISGALQADVPGVLTRTAVDLRRGLMHFINKGGAQETSPFNEATGHMLEAWLAVRHELAMPGVDALFVGRSGLRLSRGSAHHMIKARGAACGLDLHSHLFRHARVRQVLEACGDKTAQQFAKHRSLATTSEYGARALARAHGIVRSMADVDAPEQGRARA
jgi:site-specific recombinase XerD